MNILPVDTLTAEDGTRVSWNSIAIGVVENGFVHAHVR